MLIELGVVEQRHQAVLEVLGRPLRHRGRAPLRGHAPDACTAGCAATQRAASPASPTAPRGPATCPHQMPPAGRGAHRRAAPRAPRLGAAHHRATTWPAKRSLPCPAAPRSTAASCATASSTRRSADASARTTAAGSAARAMELWQMDVMGGVRLEDGRELKIVTGIDDHSRFCVCAHLTPRATARPVCEALLAAMARHGAPEQLLTDNGKVFTARFGRGTGEVLFDRLCRENGVRHLLTAPRCPTTTGKVERFHKTLRAEFLAGRVFASLEEAQAELDAWVAPLQRRAPPPGHRHGGPGEALRPGRGGAPGARRAPRRRGASARARPAHLHAAGERRGPHQLRGPRLPRRRLARRRDGRAHLPRAASSRSRHRGVLVACHARRHPAKAAALCAGAPSRASPRAAPDRRPPGACARSARAAR